MVLGVCWDCQITYRIRFPGKAPPENVILEKMKNMGCPLCGNNKGLEIG